MANTGSNFFDKLILTRGAPEKVHNLGWRRPYSVGAARSSVMEAKKGVKDEQFNLAHAPRVHIVRFIG